MQILPVTVDHLAEMPFLAIRSISIGNPAFSQELRSHPVMNY